MLKINFTAFPNLATERLILRQLEIADEHDIFALRTDERVNKFLERAKPESLADVREIIRKINDGVRNNKPVYWVITLKNAGKAIGTICLWNIDEENSTAEVGYELHPDFQGKGIMQEALSAVIKFGFEMMNLQIIEACVSAGNQNSIKLLVKNGFEKNPRSANRSDEKEEMTDMFVYSLANPAQTAGQ